MTRHATRTPKTKNLARNARKEKASARQVLAALKAAANGEIAAHSQRFFKTGRGEYAEGDRFLGIRVPTIRTLVQRYGHLPLDDTARLLSSRFHEARLFALLMLTRKFKAADAYTRSRIFDLYLNNLEHINNWDLVDCSAPAVVGAYLFDKDRDPLYQLAASDKLWHRRIAIMATFFMIKQRDFEDALAIAARLRHDPHDLIHKATGWMLREIGKRDMGAEEAFLGEHYRTMPRTMLRYAIERMPERKRQGYLSGTV